MNRVAALLCFLLTILPGAFGQVGNAQSVWNVLSSPTMDPAKTAAPQRT